MELNKKAKTFRKLIIAASVAIPLVVAALFKINIEGVDLSFLPPFYASINGLTAILLIVALIFIKQKKIKLHERVIKICMILSLIFLVSYVAYHMTSSSTVYGDLDHNGILNADESLKVASTRLIYIILLLSHIVLSVAVVPMVLFSYLLAYEDKVEKHRKLAKITWPIWFYVAMTGVIVFLMISPYYK